MVDGVLSRKTSRRKRLGRGIILPAVLILLLVPSPSVAQVREIALEAEVFRKTADGLRLAELTQGTRVVVHRTEGSWAEVDIEGWVPSAAIATSTREGHNGVISTQGGEPLRAEPSGPVSGLLLEGFLVHRIEDADGWSLVRRTGWVREAALAVPSTSFTPPGAEAARAPSAVAPGREMTAGDDALVLRSAPEGRTVVTVETGTPVTVVERRSGWTRVRVEGWVPSEQLVTADSDSVVAGVSAAALRANPDDYAGVRLRWAVQFLSLEQAEPERIDFYEGEPFLLARAPDPGDGLVYVAVPAELLAAAETLRPLQTIDILVRVRTGRSALMGVPVLDLLAIF